MMQNYADGRLDLRMKAIRLQWLPQRPHIGGRPGNRTANRNRRNRAAQEPNRTRPSRLGTLRNRTSDGSKSCGFRGSEDVLSRDKNCYKLRKWSLKRDSGFQTGIVQLNSVHGFCAQNRASADQPIGCAV